MIGYGQTEQQPTQTTAKRISGTQRSFLILGNFLVACLLNVSAQAQVLYRWKNDQGRPEVSHSIPAGVVHQGYEILDGNSMRVLERVPAQMSHEEWQRKKEREQAMAACEAALDRVNFLYERPSDIDDAEAAAIRSLEVRVQNAQQNLTHARRNLSDLESQAARRERQGTAVSKGHLAKIARANSQIATLQREISQRELEKDKMKLEYAEERRMFNVGACSSEEVANR
jgi:hypothetical protein